MAQDKKEYYKDYYIRNRDRLIKKNIENTKKRKQCIKDGTQLKGLIITRGNFIIEFV
jgi:hypothetical protein|tara:strand:+ start:2106 stop:2276 length:171 start_codon:yes stop_codon:yes gene_type:complete